MGSALVVEMQSWSMSPRRRRGPLEVRRRGGAPEAKEISMRHAVALLVSRQRRVGDAILYLERAIEEAESTDQRVSMYSRTVEESRPLFQPAARSKQPGLLDCRKERNC